MFLYFIPGHYCPKKSHAQIPCQPGTYQDEEMKQLCDPCIAGHYCNNYATKSIADMKICPSGYFCPDGTSSFTNHPCPIGTFGRKEGLKHIDQCSICPSGMYCDVEGATNATGFCAEGYYCKKGAKSKNPTEGPHANICTQGNYCPVGTGHPVPCPIGTYSNRIGLSSVDECSPCDAGKFCNDSGLTEPTDLCDAGWFCPESSTHSKTNLCSQGAYCPKGTDQELLCPPGTFSEILGLISEDQCEICPSGYFCDQHGQTSPSGTCSPRFFCPEGSKSSKEKGCPVAHFCPGNSSQPLICPPGTQAAVNLSDSCQKCPEGSYCENGNIIGPCPEGYWCPLGTDQTTMKKCPAGTFSNDTGLSNEFECKICTPGFFCDREGLTEPAGPCAAGYFCKCGSKLREPSGPCYNNSKLSPNEGNCSSDNIAGPCPIGYHCPEGTSLPKICSGGSFSNQSGLPECVKCPSGFYCPKLSEKIVCPQGHYCPPGTGTDYTRYPCPKGTYGPHTMAEKKEDCKICPAGYYCEDKGLNSTSGECDAGYYCEAGSTDARPKEGLCPIGSYCPNGVAQPVECDVGMFCDRTGLHEPSGPCSSGYYCERNSSTPEPTESNVGSFCPPGHYCVSGSFRPQPCPQGTFLNVTHGQNITDCQSCPQGFFCPELGTSNSIRECPEGYFCDGGSITGTENICPIGFYCPYGSASPQLCASGTYQEMVGKAQCKLCPPGYYCDNSNGTIKLSTSLCPPGYFCLEGTKYSHEYPCLEGFFNDQIGAENMKACKPCSKGSFCPKKGMSEPLICKAGYFCPEGSKSDWENDCPAGHFCPIGSPEPTPCPDGTYSNNTRLESIIQCDDCLPGYFCPNEATIIPKEHCDAGFFCSSGSSNSQQYVCPIGSYCPNGTATPIPCPEGMYSNEIGQKSIHDCNPCMPGMYCNGSGLIQPSGPCDAGFYCPGKSHVSVPNPPNLECPIGYHCPLGSSIPRACSSGYYTNHTQAAECQICPAGFFCLPIDEKVNGSLSYFICPKGYYCPEGTGANISRCPPGTWSNIFGLKQESECLKCPPGQFCHGSEWPTGSCYKGHYCSSGVDIPNPDSISNQGDGGICPPGTYCNNGSEVPTPCPKGRFTHLDLLVAVPRKLMYNQKIFPTNFTGLPN